MTDPCLSDEFLMLAYQGGDLAAFEQLYARWRGRLYRYLRHQCGDSGRAEELYQEVWLKVVNGRQHYVVAAKFSTWLFRIARHRLIDHWRAAGRDPLALRADQAGEDDALGMVAAPLQEGPPQWLQRKDLAERLDRALAALPAVQREAFILAEEGELSLEEIGALCAVGRETVKSRLRYAISKLRAALGDER